MTTALQAHVLQITPRERQVLQLLAEGVAPGEVAAALGISAGETDVLLTTLFRAMGAATQVDAITCARRRGLLAT